MMSKQRYDYLVVGAGLFGAVFAHEAKKAGKSVLVIDKRPNIAGNVYTEDIEGIHVHKYGAHIFHTNNQEVWNYVQQFATFNRFTNPDHYLNFTNAAAWNKIFKRSYIEQLKLDFQPVRNGNDVYFTVNAIGLADRITVLDEKLVNYRVNQASGLVCSISKSPLSPIQAWMDIAENLEKYEGFGERSFANKAIGSMIYMLQNFQKWDAFRQAVEALKEYGLEKMHIQIQKDGYYYNAWNGECVRHLYQDTPEEFAVFFAYSVYIQKSEAYAEKRGMSQDLSLQKKAYKDLTKQNRANEKKIARDESKITRLEEKRDVLKEKNVDLKRQLTEQKKKNEALGKKLKTVEQENQKIRASWSFRIGKVLMWLPGKIKRLFRKK